MRNFLITIILACSIAMQAQEPLKLKVELAEETSTERIYNFTTINMVGIIGWQFQMDFDGTKMKFKEIRNAVQTTQNSSNFHEPTPGNLRSVWLDYDLQADPIPDSVVLFQLVFEILDPEASSLCFRTSQEYFEFILDVTFGLTLAEFLISDDCYQGFSIFLESTATENPEVIEVLPVKDVFLSSTGTLSFTSVENQELQLSLLDINGKLISTIDHREYTEGRNTVQCKSVVPGMYLVKVRGEDGIGKVIKVFAN